MKAVFIGGGVSVLALGIGAWLAMSGSTTQIAATAPVAATPVTAAPKPAGFDYDTATLSDRRLWLTKLAPPLATNFDRTLPKGGGEQPDMNVTGWAVDARRRAIELQIQVRGPYGINQKSLPSARAAMIAQVCPSYAQSPLGTNRVALLHTFLGQDRREELSVEVNPLVCREYM